MLFLETLYYEETNVLSYTLDLTCSLLMILLCLLECLTVVWYILQFPSTAQKVTDDRYISERKCSSELAFRP